MEETSRNAKNPQTEKSWKHVTTLRKHNGLQARVIVRRENYKLDASLKISFYFHKTSDTYFNYLEEAHLGCYIYHGVSGKCKYVCDKGERKIYGMSQCMGRICCA